MAMQSCRCAVLMTLFLIKFVFCVSSRKHSYQLYDCLKVNILDYGRGSNFTFQISVTLFLVRPKSLWEPLNEIESLSTGKRICGIRTKSILCLSTTQTVPTKLYLRQPILIGSQTTYCTHLLIGTQRKETLFKLMNILISQRALC